MRALRRRPAALRPESKLYLQLRRAYARGGFDDGLRTEIIRFPDQHLTVAALEPKFFGAWCRGVGREDLIEKQFEKVTPAVVVNNCR